MAPQAPRMDGEDRNPIEWGRMFASMFDFKRVKRDIGTKHSRVYRCEISNMQTHRIDEEPIGVTIVRNPAILNTVGKSKEVGGYWVKVGSQWLSASTKDDIFIRATAVSEAEYGTDLAFGLWPELKSSNRPFRSWIELNKRLLKKWNVAVATAGLGSITYFTNKSVQIYDGWFIAAMVAALIAIVSTTTFMFTNNFEK